MFSNSFGSHTKGVECGLIRIIKRDEWTSEPAPIPLVSVDVVASVIHAVAQVQVTQVFINKEEQPIEAVYYFPIDSLGAVTHFEAQVEGRKIKGVVKANEEAEEQYEKAIKQHKTAFLAQENKPDIFKVQVGFLKPGSQAKIVIGYTTEVRNEKDSSAIRFFIPTTVAPRYVPQRCEDEKSQDLANMIFSDSSPAPMTIKVHVSIQGGIKSIESPTHKITVADQSPVPEKKSWTKAQVQLAAKTTDMDRDFVLLVTPAETHKPRLYTEKQENSLAVMAHLIPSFKLDEQSAELIFVLDRSGSMMGESIALAKKALILFLHSLPMSCYFNIIGFGSTYKFLFPKSVKYDDKTLKTAVAHAKGLVADLGGTEILEPLKQIYSCESIPGYLRQIFVLTDGEVGNTEEVIGLTKAKAHETRVFSLGIGDGASHHLVEGIAAAGGGTSAFVTYNETVDKKVLQQLKNALQPSLTNVRVSWHGVSSAPSTERPKSEAINMVKTVLGYGKPKTGENIEKSCESPTMKNAYRQAPEKIPPIFDGSQLLVFGIFEGEEKPTGATISADSPDGPLSIDVELTEENDVGATGMLHKLAVIKIVRKIELKVAALGCRSYDEDSDGKGTEEYKKEIIEIAVPQGISSAYTSFVAVDTESDTRSSENWMMQSRWVPNQFISGWHGRVPTTEDIIMLNECRSLMMANISALLERDSTLGDLHCQFSARSSPPCKSSSFTPSSLLPSFSGGKIKLFGAKITKRLSSAFSFSEYSEATSSSSTSQPPRSSLTTSTAADVDSVLTLRRIRTKEEPELQPGTKLQDSQDLLEKIVGFQSFNGSFPWNEDFVKTLGLDFSLVKQEAEKQKWDLTGWATALAIAFFSEKMSERKESWELVVVKARKWLSKLSANINSETMIEAAKSFLKESTKSA